ncbi:VOC family protein [Agathobaculum desmolans]|uniref:VOC family protein n=1 Tax=Agathobaculum desmolans TaxID=39484 RepID=UPI0004E0E560|nr:VOC family protein [Agathobaculum desmolans]
MTIDHMALYTQDLERMRLFYETYFDGKANTMYQNPKTGLQTYFISFAEGARLELMTRPAMEACERSRLWTGWAHLAFKAGTRENVDALTERLRTDGYEVTGDPRVTGDGYYESCVLDPDGNMIEITA